MKFLLEAVPRLLTVDHSTPTKAIIDAVKQKYGQEIALRQAQKVKSSLCPKNRQSLDLSINGEEIHSAAARPPFHDDTATQHTIRAIEGTGMELDVQDDQDPSSVGGGGLPRERASPTRNQRPIASAASLPGASSHDAMQSARLPDGNMNGHHNIFAPHLASFNNRMMATPSSTTYTMSTGKTPREVRNEAAVLFQRASEKFQEACFLHAEASRLFASVANS